MPSAPPSSDDWWNDLQNSLKSFKLLPDVEQDLKERRVNESLSSKLKEAKARELLKVPPATMASQDVNPLNPVTK